jgi:hypothetical protein
VAAAGALVLAVGDSMSAELGGTNAADGCTELADGAAEPLCVALAVTAAGDVVATADDAAVGGAVDVAATRGEGDSVLVGDGLAAVVGVTTVEGATTAAVLV